MLVWVMEYQAFRDQWFLKLRMNLADESALRMNKEFVNRSVN